MYWCRSLKQGEVEEEKEEQTALHASLCIFAGLQGQMWYWMLLGKAVIFLLSLTSLAVKHKRGQGRKTTLRAPQQQSQLL